MALSKVKKKELSVNSAARQFSIPRSTLQRYVKNLKAGAEVNNDDQILQKLGKKSALSQMEEKVLADLLGLCADWGYPFQLYDVRCLVRDYLNEKVKESGSDCSVFYENMHGDDWVRGFLKRHQEISLKFTENIKRSRAAVSKTVITDYFNELKSTLQDVPVGNIVNYDETAFVDNVNKKKCLVRKGKRAENIMDVSKTSTFTMFAIADSGTLLPLYVCYKAKNTWDLWEQNGPPGALYQSSPSGWFTRELFEHWFFNVIVPYFRRKDGPKVLIGDNLCSHASYKVVKKAQDEGIRFTFLPANSTHLCQPLDVAVFRSVKQNWSVILRDWKQKYKGILPKSCFPQLLKETIDRTLNLEDNIRSGFRATGIRPFNPNAVLKNLPDNDTESKDKIGKRYLGPLLNLMNKNRFGASTTKIGRRKKIDTPSGRSVSVTDFEAIQNIDERDNENYPDLENLDGECNQENNCDDNFCPIMNKMNNIENGNANLVGENGNSTNLDVIYQDNGVEPWKIEVGSYYRVKFEMEYGNSVKIYIGVILSISDTTAEMKFLRRNKLVPPNGVFNFPNVDDIDNVEMCNILSKVDLISEKRGFYVFANIDKTCL